MSEGQHAIQRRLPGGPRVWNHLPTKGSHGTTALQAEQTPQTSSVCVSCVHVPHLPLLKPASFFNILKVFLSVSSSCLPKPFLTEADVANLECRDRPCFYRFRGLRVGSSSVRQRSWELHPLEIGAPLLMLLHPDFPIKISALHPCGTNSVHSRKSETST